MRIDIITLFPEMCEAVMGESIIGRARKSGAIEVNCHQLRDYAFDKHRRVDDAPYGGGMGMLMMAEPIALCYEAICEKTQIRPHFIYMSPQGETLTQNTLKRLSAYDNICLLCGHYEGVDERLIEEYIDEEISIGDYVLTGGELPALVLADSLARLVPGVLASDECFEMESHYNGLLEYPQYTRPQVWHGREVPSVLLSGHHKNIEQFRREEAIKRTARKRPELLDHADLTEEERQRVAPTGGYAPAGRSHTN
ncbi:MAG: tRNA (guanosine(37)-N1)-methyltransferase TrmD [Clostridia bacterium]|nr:tRNA (guanosine(37)-N1)-methyltransferase TrmD [Clostridia bacterium]